MKHFLFLVWLRGQTRPKEFTVGGENIADAMLRMFACERISFDDVTKLEIYP